METGRLEFLHPSGITYGAKSDSTRIEGRQKGMACSFIQKQNFINQFNDPVDLKYVYQTDYKFCVYNIRFFIDGEEIQAKIRIKEESKEIHNEARSKGYSSIMSKTGKNGFNEIKLGNIPPKSTVRVETYFIFMASLNELKRVDIRIPIQNNFNDNVEIIFDIEFPCEIENVEVCGVNKGDVKHIEIEKFQNFQNFTSILISENLKHPFHSHIIRNGEYSCVNFIPPVIDDYKRDVELVFMVDCSFSMSGDRIKRASECLEIFIRSLPYNCSFNIYRFGTTFVKLFPIAKKYNQNNMETALIYANKLEADLGGTLLQNPLKVIYDNENKNCILFILSDGEDQNESNVIDIVTRNTDTRIFSIGIGNDSDHGLLELMAKKTVVRGKPDDFT